MKEFLIYFIPVVTDPRKAVFALKWAVKEMNERYKQMANLNVRNIESYNKIMSKKEYKEGKLVKKVQIGFDSTSGRPIYQNKEIDVKPLPFIVIVVDEMADLMLASGKEIEVSIQSLAQKARAAGIHLNFSNTKTFCRCYYWNYKSKLTL